MRYSAPESLAVRAADPMAYPVHALDGRFLRVSADTLWLRPHSVRGTWSVTRAGGTVDSTAALGGPWADSIAVPVRSASVSYSERRFSRGRTLKAIGGVALLWVAYVAFDMIVNGPFKES